MATSISTYCGEHLWAASKRSVLGGPVEWPSLRIASIPQRNAEQTNNNRRRANEHHGASNKCSQAVLVLLEWTSRRDAAKRPACSNPNHGSRTMIETIPSLQQVALQARLAHAAITLAKYEAEKAVRQALRGQGLKPQYIAKREIVTLPRTTSQSIPS